MTPKEKAKQLISKYGSKHRAMCYIEGVEKGIAESMLCKRSVREYWKQVSNELQKL